MLDLTLVRFLAQTFSAAIVSSARPGLTFATLQWTVALLVRTDHLTVAPSFAWLLSIPALLVALVLALLETWARHDPDAAQLLRDLKIDHLLGSFGVFSSALLFVSLGLPEGEAAVLAAGDGGTSGLPLPQAEPVGLTAPVPSSEGSDLALAVALAAGADQPNAVKVGAVTGALGLHTALAWSRSQLLSFLAEFDLERVVARLETGGAVALLLGMLLAPYIATAFLVLASMALLATAVSVRAVQRAADRACRVPCAACDHAVRPEARRCPSCGADCTPQTVLAGSLAERGWRAARQRLATGRAELAAGR